MDKVDLSVIVPAYNETANYHKGALELFRQLRPDLVTMDVTMRNTDGFTAAETILKEYPDARVVLLTLRQEEEKHFLEEAAEKMGIKAVILKPFTPEELKAAVMKVLNE